ncbi:phosphoprotein [Morogoro maize-associated virus]|uniref:Phosphoprotein n=1 Tax=Morogoro maize-associated virus TaxID=2497337 RepID=A0A3Q9D1J8_9RHAB|nr:phosphoprotein [Morogoro maize-associated virus]AZP55471.1 phosphoprotein [Morogoro maize-associated virus]
MSISTRRSGRYKPLTPARELLVAEENPTQVHAEFTDLQEPYTLTELRNTGESSTVTEHRSAAMPPLQTGFLDVLKVERAAPVLVGQPIDSMVGARLAEKGFGVLTEREKAILAIGVHCGEIAKDSATLASTKRWIEEELKTQLTTLAATTRALTEASTLQKTYALFQSPNPKRKKEAMESYQADANGVDITALNHDGLEDIWQSYSHEAKEDAIDVYLRSILNLDPDPLYEEDGWGRHLSFIPRWQLVAFGKNQNQYKTVYADDIQHQKHAIEKVISKRARLN